MAVSEDSTHSHALTRRTLIAGATLLPAVAVLAEVPAGSPSATPLSLAIDEYLSLKGEDDLLDRQIAGLKARTIAPAIQAQDRARRARDEVAAQLEIAASRAMREDGSAVEMFRRVRAENLSPEAAAELIENHIKGRVGGDAKLAGAIAAHEHASEAVKTIAETSGYNALVQRSEVLADRIYDAQARVEATPASSLSELLRKVEIMAIESSWVDVSMVDLFDLIRPDIEALQGAAYQPLPETEALERRVTWSGSAAA